ncbi:MAG: SPOR domain-containing protein [Halieaceae bacterium]
MNDILKQRLVGALVLIALGVVFWPVIFVESERREVDQSAQVPAIPVLQDAKIAAPEPLPDIEPVSARDEISLHDSPPTILKQQQAEPPQETETVLADDASAAPQLDPDGIPVAWVLQVISVSKREKADALTAQLIEQGYKAYHRALRRNDEVLYRVYIGPVFERDKLDRVKQDIDRELHVKAIITRYLP